jgi:hypothetical protein
VLRLSYFFKGMLKKEEAASAFLAMALDGVPSFRDYFFRSLVSERSNAATPERLKSGQCR